MRKFVTLDPISLDEVVGQSGWQLGPQGDSLMDRHGNEAFYFEDPDGHITFTFNADTDYRDLLERVPCEPVDE